MADTKVDGSGGGGGGGSWADVQKFIKHHAGVEAEAISLRAALRKLVSLVEDSAPEGLRQAAEEAKRLL